MFYAYIWMRSTNTNGWPIGSPYYIGKGKGDRASTQADHRLKVPRDSKFIQIILCRDEESAFETEKFFIKYYGRLDLGTGCLRNLTAGGEGITSEGFSPEVREKMRKSKLGKPLYKTRGHKNYQNATSEQLSSWAKIAQEKQVGIFAPGFDRTKGIRAERARLSPEEKKARATKASHSIPPEQRILNGKLGALKGAHIRYHVNRGIKSESCRHCSEG